MNMQSGTGEYNGKNTSNSMLAHLGQLSGADTRNRILRTTPMPRPLGARTFCSRVRRFCGT